MSHTFDKNYYHLIWSTKERYQMILPEYKDRIFEFLGGSLKTLNCLPIQVGGVSDHVHILALIPPKFPVSDIIRDIKIGSTKWINSTLPKAKGFCWQEGYGSFTVSASQTGHVKDYIINQEKHHKTMSFREEFIEFLNLHEIEFDEKYLWK